MFCVVAKEIKDEKGNLLFFEAEQIDITKRILIESELLSNQAILKQKLNELERFNSLTVDRELKMVELKKEINDLLEKLGEKPKVPDRKIIKL